MNKKRFLTDTAQSALMTWGISVVSGMSPGNIITVVIFVLCLFLLHKTGELRSEKPLKRSILKKTTVILSALYTVFFVSVDHERFLSGLTNPLFRMVLVLAVTLGLFLLFYHTVLFLLSVFEKISAPGTAERNGRGGLVGFYVNHIFLFTFLFCLLGYLPFFLYLFPGVMTPDSVVQLGQVLGTESLSNHHPVAHTFFIGLLYRIGWMITKDRTAAVSFYSAFQLLFLCFCASFAVSTMKKLGMRPLPCFLASCFYALVPYHGVFSVTMWKDIPFAGIVTLFLSALLTENLPLLFLSGAGICLFRSNGWYAFLLFLPVYIIFSLRRKDKASKKLFGLPAGIVPVLAAFIIALVIKYPVYHLLGVESPDFVESLSIPLQQVASVIAYNGDLAPEDRAEIEKVIDTSHVKRLYEPTFADNIKELVRAGHPEYLDAHKGRFLLLWARTGLRNPVAYFRAYVRQTCGYYFPDEYFPVADAEGIAGSAYGITHTPLVGGPKVIKAKEILLKLGNMLPLYSVLWSMGAVFWIMLFFMGVSVVRGKKERVIFYVPCLLLVLTVLIATPVAAEFRYVYFLVFALPFYPVIALYDSEKDSL